jgi:peptidoglycan-N-acetylglucosamine deacetylase
VIFEKPNYHLTIDDGPSKNFVELVNWLDSKNIKATFFSLGHLIKIRMRDVTWAIERGHCVANHSYSHPDFSGLNYLQGQAEIIATQSLLDKAYKDAGVESKRIFRFPSGRREKKTIQFLEKEGFYNPWKHLVKGVDVKWTFDLQDWRLNREDVLDEILDKAKLISKKEHVILAHDRHKGDLVPFQKLCESIGIVEMGD